MPPKTAISAITACGAGGIGMATAQLLHRLCAAFVTGAEIDVDGGLLAVIGGAPKPEDSGDDLPIRNRKRE